MCCQADAARGPSLTFQQGTGLLPEDFHQPLVQADLLQPGQQLLLIATHFLLGVEAVGHRPLLAQADQGRLHRQRRQRLALLQVAAGGGARSLRPPTCGWRGGMLGVQFRLAPPPLLRPPLLINQLVILFLFFSVNSLRDSNHVL